MRKGSIRIIAIITLGVLLCIGLTKIAFSSPATAQENSSETSMQYELPKLIPTTWIGRR